MDEKQSEVIDGQGPSGTPVIAVAPVASPKAKAASPRWSGRDKTLLLCTVIVAVTVLVSTLLGAWMIGRDSNKPVVGYTGIDAARYQAVFLSNGQVYFGKLSDGGPELVTLKDIWYLQVQQGVQSADTLKDAQSQVSLAKLGNELHGPDDSMSIAKDQVLFWENLKNDSKVVKAISDAK